MKERDIGAFIFGTVPGLLSSYIVVVAAAGFGHTGIFVISCLISLLIVCLIAGRRMILLGFVSNLVMTLYLTVYFLFFSPDVHGFDVLYVALVMLGVSIPLAFLISVPIHLLRKKLGRQDEVQHVFSRDT